MEERLDKLLIQRKLVANRSQAEKLIRETGVKVNGKLETKTGKRFPIDSEIIVPEDNWVSQDALKLLEAKEFWSLDFNDKIAADFGSGKGGAVEVFLKNGAKTIFAIDREKDLLDATLLASKKVLSVVGLPFRELTKKLIPESIEIAMVDVDSAPLNEVLPFIHEYIVQDGLVIAVLKPQLELKDKKLLRGGVVKLKQELIVDIIRRFTKESLNNNLSYVGHTMSPLLNETGNFELLVLLKKV